MNSINHKKMCVDILTIIHDFADYVTMVAIARTCRALYEHHNAEIEVVQAQFEHDIETHQLTNVPRDVLDRYEFYEYESVFINRCGSDDMLRFYREKVIEEEGIDPINSLLYNLVHANDATNFKKYAAWIDEGDDLAEYVFQEAVELGADDIAKFILKHHNTGCLRFGIPSAIARMYKSAKYILDSGMYTPLEFTHSIGARAVYSNEVLNLLITRANGSQIFDS